MSFVRCFLKIIVVIRWVELVKDELAFLVEIFAISS